MALPFEFDFKKPDYRKVWKWRYDTLTNIRENPETIDAFKVYYRENPTEFISHWGSTFDPRNAEIGLPTIIPFVLFERQEEAVAYIIRKWKNRETGLMEKSRDMGLSWLTVSLSCTLCLFYNDISIGFGSRKQEYVDKSGDPKSLFWKARMFLDKLPIEFKGGFDIKADAPFMRLGIPDSGSSITGEAGDNIGRGDRKSIYIVDEAAYLEHPEMIDASLSATTNCRIDISSVHGMNNPFAQKRHAGKIEPFTFHWRSDPRKDEIWYEREKLKIDNPVIVAQEIDINYAASAEGVVIPAEWISAAIDACGQLGIETSGAKSSALDIADEGIDLNAFAAKYGIELVALDEWSGKNGDFLFTAQRAQTLYDENDCVSLNYDADGMGAGIRSDFRVINETRKSQARPEMRVSAFRGSGMVISPDREMIKGRKNKDYFQNRKAQAWFALRLRFQQTYRAIEAKKAGTVYEYEPDNLISISGKLKNLTKLIMELSQPTYSETVAGKIIIDKSPDNTRSPNLADVVMMVYSPPATRGLFS